MIWVHFALPCLPLRTGTEFPGDAVVGFIHSVFWTTKTWSWRFSFALCSFALLNNNILDVSIVPCLWLKAALHKLQQQYMIQCSTDPTLKTKLTHSGNIKIRSHKAQTHCHRNQCVLLCIACSISAWPYCMSCEGYSLTTGGHLLRPDKFGCVWYTRREIRHKQDCTIVG